MTSKWFSRVAKPIARVFLKKASGGWQEFWPEVDSGAVVSLFNREDCDILGYELKDGMYCELSGISGNPIPCYVHKIDVKIGEEIINVRIAFSDTDRHKLLLGRLDVFDNFEIDLRGKTLDTFFARDF